MTTHPSEETLHAYVDRLLKEASGSTAGPVDEHLRECVSCRALVDDLRTIAQTAARLGPLSPPPDLWARLERSRNTVAPLRGGSSSQWWGGLAAAAVVVLCAALGVSFDLRSNRKASNARAAVNADAALQIAGDDYRDTVVALQEAASVAEETLGADVPGTLRDDIAIVDAAIRETRVALEQYPDSNLVQERLLDGLRIKVALLQTAAELAPAFAARTEG